jgi:Flp pilus assembly protein TadG
MKPLRRILRDQKGTAIIEAAFGLPILIMMIWMFFQLAQMYRAVAGIQQALGEGARYATLCLSPTNQGCTPPTGAQIKAEITRNVYGIGPGDFDVPVPVVASEGTSNYYDLTVNYTQKTNLLLLPGPTIALSRSKRVWTAGI